MTFRDKLIATLQRLAPVLAEPGVLVVGSEVPNLLEPAAASTLVVSQDVDVGVPVDRVEAIKRRLRDVRDLVQSPDEPSVYIPEAPGLIEANFLALDSTLREPDQTYLLDDPELPLMVFGPLGLLRPGPTVAIADLRVPLPRTGDLVIEKLLTDRTGEKGVRDLLVVAGLLAVASPGDVEEAAAVASGLSPESRHAVRSNLTVLSLMDGRAGMPDPAPVRSLVRQLLALIEETA